MTIPMNKMYLTRLFLKISLLTLPLIILLLLWFPLVEGSSELGVPILLYHRFGPVASDSMTVTTTVFESQIKYLRDNGYTVIPLGRLVDYYLGKEPPPPPRSVVITVDDGHKSVFTEMLPLVRKYRIPVTLFLYPSAISNASYATTWEQLREMKRQGFLIFNHTRIGIPISRMKRGG